MPAMLADPLQIVIVARKRTSSRRDCNGGSVGPPQSRFGHVNNHDRGSRRTLGRKTRARNIASISTADVGRAPDPSGSSGIAEGRPSPRSGQLPGNVCDLRTPRGAPRA